VQYWVRCLPPDFPAYQWEPHPEAGTPTAGYYLVGNYTAVGPYAFILDRNGVPVWYHREQAPGQGVVDVDNVLDATVSYIPASGSLPVELYDVGSKPSERLAAPNGPPIDIHDFQVLPNGDYVMISNPTESGVDLTGLSSTQADGGTTPLGKDSYIEGCRVLELDRASGKVVWTWNARDHLNPVDVTEHVQGGGLAGDASVPDGGIVWDVFHCNSVDVDHATGNLLLSGQLMDSFVYIDRTSGAILWKMGGSPATIDNAPFIPDDSPFNGQHDVRLQAGWSMCTGGQLTMYDDHTFTTPPASSRAAAFDVHLGAAGVCDGGTPEGGAPSAHLVWEYEGSTHISASGSFRILADGSRVIGWGITSHLMTEVDEKGHDLLDLYGVGAVQSYRAIKVPLAAFDLDDLRANAGADH
jgi:hypothetical protein